MKIPLGYFDEEMNGKVLDTLENCDHFNIASGAEESYHVVS